MDPFEDFNDMIRMKMKDFVSTGENINVCKCLMKQYCR